MKNRLIGPQYLMIRMAAATTAIATKPQTPPISRASVIAREMSTILSALLRIMKAATIPKMALVQAGFLARKSRIGTISSSRYLTTGAITPAHPSNAGISIARMSLPISPISLPKFMNSLPANALAIAPPNLISQEITLPATSTSTSRYLPESLINGIASRNHWPM